MKKVLIVMLLLISTAYAQRSKIGFSFPLATQLTGDHSGITDEGKKLDNFGPGAGLTFDIHWFFFQEKMLLQTKLGCAVSYMGEASYFNGLFYNSLNYNTNYNMYYGMGFGYYGFGWLDNISNLTGTSIIGNLGKEFFRFLKFEVQYHYALRHRKNRSMDRLEFYVGVVF